MGYVASKNMCLQCWYYQLKLEYCLFCFAEIQEGLKAETSEESTEEGIFHQFQLLVLTRYSVQSQIYCVSQQEKKGREL